MLYSTMRNVVVGKHSTYRSALRLILLFIMLSGALFITSSRAFAQDSKEELTFEEQITAFRFTPLILPYTKEQLVGRYSPGAIIPLDTSADSVVPAKPVCSSSEAVGVSLANLENNPSIYAYDTISNEAIKSITAADATNDYINDTVKEDVLEGIDDVEITKISLTNLNSYRITAELLFEHVSNNNETEVCKNNRQSFLVDLEEAEGTKFTMITAVLVADIEYTIVIDEELAATIVIDEELAAKIGIDEELAAKIGIDEELAATIVIDEELAAKIGIDELIKRLQQLLNSDVEETSENTVVLKGDQLILAIREDERMVTTYDFLIEQKAKATAAKAQEDSAIDADDAETRTMLFQEFLDSGTIPDPVLRVPLLSSETAIEIEPQVNE